MNKITAEHLSRSAYVYVRQSTADQVANNQESRRRQYGLAARANALGWSNVVVIDDDLGRSGGGGARPGFERLLSAICTGGAGAVLAIEASRFARNGRGGGGGGGIAVGGEDQTGGEPRMGGFSVSTTKAMSPGRTMSATGGSSPGMPT